MTGEKDVLGLMDIFGGKPSPLANDPAVPLANPKVKKSVNEGDGTNPDFVYLWDNCKLDDEVKSDVAYVCSVINKYRDRYEAVEKLTGVKWYFIAAVHYRETSLSFLRAFHNGDKIIGTGQKTTHVPIGRGPFDTWESSVVDALHLLKIDQITDWSVYNVLELAEKYNGTGYRKRKNEAGKVEYSPYVWAGTNQSDETGKYKADGIFDHYAPEKQLGVAALFLGLGVS